MLFLNPGTWCVLAQARIAPLTTAVEAPTAPATWPAPTPWLLLALLPVIAGLIAVLYWKRVAPPASDDQAALFAELCRCNHLSHRQRQMLLQLAESRQVANPNRLLLDIELWGVDDDPAPPLAPPRLRHDLQRLRSLLFTHSTN